MVVIASDEHDAAMKFKKKYPHPYDEMVLNCAAYYSEKEWNESVSKYYTGELVEVIGMNIKLRIKVNYNGTKYFTMSMVVILKSINHWKMQRIG